MLKLITNSCKLFIFEQPSIAGCARNILHYQKTTILPAIYLLALMAFEKIKVGLTLIATI